MQIKKIAASGALALTLSLGAVGTACVAPAYAADPTPNPSPSVNASTINPNGTYQMNITKYLGAPVSGLKNDGTQVTNVGLPTLSGVNFDIYQVAGVDLTTNAGWTAATDLQGVAITADNITSGTVTGKSGKVYTLTKAGTTTTAAGGVATFNGGPGLYLVNENLASSGATVTSSDGKTVKTSAVTPSAPYLVTLPMTNPADTSQWMSTVYTYPKNAADDATKAVKDLGTVTSDTSAAPVVNSGAHTLEFTLTGTITPGLTGDQMGMYVLTDKLDSRLTYASVPSVKLSTGATLVVGTDYDVYVNGVKGGTGAGGDNVQIVMTAAGLAKLAAAKAADSTATVVATLDATATTEGNGTIPNQVSLIPNQAYYQSNTGSTTPYNPANPPATPIGITSNTTESHYGDLTVTKTDGQSGATLSGAVFSLYQTMSSSMTPTAGDCAAVTSSGTPIMTGITTDGSGLATVKGLQESDFYNNAQVAAGGQYITYCLVETKAPSGYNLLAQPVPFVINAAGAVVPLTIKNEKQNLANSLPLTGGAGAAGMGIGGLVLIGGAVALVVARRRHHDDEDLLEA